MLWWHWIVIGLLLCMVEVLTPVGGVTFFFGVAALLVAVFVGLDCISLPWIQLVTFAVLSIVLWVSFRQRYVKLMTGKSKGDSDDVVGLMGTVTTAMAPGGHGAIEVRGTMWQAHNVGDVALGVGCECQVVRREGLKLAVVKPV